MNAPGPVPTYPSTRLIGLELELDAGSTQFKSPGRVDGWSDHSDGSLSNGREYVLNPPLPVTEALATVQAFLKAANAVKMNTTRKGGYHVHVQAHDLGYENMDSVVRLVKLYTHFQSVIDTLVAKSRCYNYYCPPYSMYSVNVSYLVKKFGLNYPATSRGDAKGTRAYSAVNLAMLRCVTKPERSVEFRQGSVSKRVECVWGWACFVTALVDLSHDTGADKVLSKPATLESLAWLIDYQCAKLGGKLLGEWIHWRYHFLNDKPTKEQIEDCVRAASRRKPVGLFTISRLMDVNLAMAKKSIEEAVSQGLLRDHGNLRFSAASPVNCEDELIELARYAEQRQAQEAVA